MVMLMAKTCRFCGEELDEETFFLNEAAMMEEVAAIRQEQEQAKAEQERQARRARLLKVAGLLVLVTSGGLMLVDQTAVQAAAGIGCVVGVLLSVMGLKAARVADSGQKPAS
jgi:hypothetical protein